VTRIDRREFGVRFLRLTATLALPTGSTRAAASGLRDPHRCVSDLQSVQGRTPDPLGHLVEQ